MGNENFEERTGLETAVVVVDTLQLEKQLSVLISPAASV